MRMARVPGCFSRRANVELPLARCFVFFLLCIRPSHSDFGSNPHIHIDGYQDGGIRLVCTAGGWHPELKVLWRDDGGRNVPSTSEKIIPDKNGSFEIQTTYVVGKHSHKNLSCLVSDSTLSQEKTATLYISDAFFQRVSRCGVSRALISASCMILWISLIALAVYLSKEQKANAVRLASEIAALEREIDWRRARSHAVDLTLDRENAPSCLRPSEDQKSVHPLSEDGTREAPTDPEKLENTSVVMGREVFTSGKHYWEVDVTEKTGWSLGVCCKGANESGQTDWQFWGLSLRNGRYKRLTSDSAPLPVNVTLRKVGFLLDYSEGEISVYNVEGKSKLFTEVVTFTGTIRAFFNPGHNNDGGNSAPLTICSVPEWD